MSPIFSELGHLVQTAASVNLFNNTFIEDLTNMPEQPKFPVMPPDSPPTKRKRGRPPKATSLTSQITTRINININTSPMNSSPIAESNSNQIVKQGAPDCFTPLMRVSPSIKKKRRSSSTSTTPKRVKGKGLVSPVSVGTEKRTREAYSPFAQVNPKTLDNMSYITQSDSQIYHTPPNTAYDSPKKISVPNYMSHVVSEIHQHTHVNESGYQNSESGLLPSASVPLPRAKSISGNEDFKDKNKHQNEKHKDGPKLTKSKLYDFPLKLTVDSMGRAVLQTDFLSLKQPKESSKNSPPDYPKVNQSERSNMSNSEEDSSRNSNFMESDTRAAYSSVQSSSTHINTQQNVLRRFNSDITAYSTSSNSNAWSATEIPQPMEKLPTLPQTPKLKDNYFYSTGFTPTNNLAFNFTPQFNSMMYPTMNLNSPQRKKDGTNHQQFIMNQEYFMNGMHGQNTHSSPAQNSAQNNTINMSDFMNMTSASTQQNKQDPQRAPLFNTSLMPSSSSSAASMASDDSGDARFALKKIMYIKRK